MTGNYYTLHALLGELRTELVGASFLEAYSHRANELRLKFDKGTLVAMLRPIDGALFFSSREEQRPRTNTQSFFTELEGSRVIEFSIAPNDRLITLQFSESPATQRPRFLELHYYGTPNAVLVAENESGEREILTSFKKLALSDAGKLDDETKVANPLAFPMLGKRYQKEAESRGDSPDFHKQLAEELLCARSAYLYRRGDDVLLSLVPLRSLGANWELREYPSINEAVRTVIVERAKLARIKGIRSELLKNIDAQIARLERARADMRRGVENSNRAERYVAIANAILMVAHEIPRTATEVMLEIEERPEKIKLDPQINPYENAARYFDRSKRAKESKENLKVRTKEVALELSKLNELRMAAQSESDTDELLRLQRVTGKETSAIAKSGDLAPVYRTYTVAGGMIVLVGKNAKQNDELTLHVAKKEDLWLHARGVAGSHVILQTGKRTQIPKESIEQAAEIAAYYSDAKTQGIAPVSYTQKKYIRKPKGAAPGAVVMEREEVVMVRPQIRGSAV